MATEKNAPTLLTNIISQPTLKGKDNKRLLLAEYPDANGNPGAPYGSRVFPALIPGKTWEEHFINYRNWINTLVEIEKTGMVIGITVRGTPKSLKAASPAGSGKTLTPLLMADRAFYGFKLLHQNEITKALRAKHAALLADDDKPARAAAAAEDPDDSKML